jgi:GT2 family glycosyltransferase
MNPVLILTHNCVSLSERAIASVLIQDIETSIYVIDNGSTDGTVDKLRRYVCISYVANKGVSRGWNDGLDMNFIRSEHCLVVNNDVVLPPWFYRELLSYEVSFVSGVSVDNMDMIREPAGRMSLSPSPDFSAFLIRRDAWEKVGPFDETMKFYASDNDWHVRAHRAGVKLWKANVPFYHERSSTLNNAPSQEAQEIRDQADKDRAVFFEKYGCAPWGPGYDELFK